ncbi:pre-mRNA-processing factor 17 isoform X2 [Prunus yedoensis var. nudiflora]|uniref:Pre-mRNA-processing factor 17 isoform X2 n=1 Tax=Prunus yedoensis var. nudiflora TaxID=2094558 RepID=A0A314XW79_PRUYE|nr:pre-mRNA-processing factor 17 isoform X2 [Prunus yedoensis var. nudiflora]
MDSKECVKIYKAHTGSIVDMCISFDGSNCLTSSVDQEILCWDLESGIPIAKLKQEHVPLVVKFIPEQQNVMVAGCSDGRIITWDIREREQYHVFVGHVNRVNSITFVHKKRSFVSTGADKSTVLWDFAGTQILKSTGEQHEILSMSLHPLSDFLAGQTLSGQIIVYGQDLEQIDHKHFSGQKVNDTECEVSISPDGFNIMSGDGQGKLWIWDWNSCQVRRTVKCHAGSCLGAAWHPFDPTKFATCGRDGYIKLWSNGDLPAAALTDSLDMVGGEANAQEENDTDNAQEENDNVSAALLMIAIATILMTTTMNAKSLIPEENHVKILGFAAKSLNVFCTAGSIGITLLWWGLTVMAYKIRPYRVVSILGLVATLVVFWFGMERAMSHIWFLVNVSVQNICLVVLVTRSIVRICSGKSKP